MTNDFTYSDSPILYDHNLAANLAATGAAYFVVTRAIPHTGAAYVAEFGSHYAAAYYLLTHNLYKMGYDGSFYAIHAHGANDELLATFRY